MQGYTEDDTFDALRRIPFDEMRNRLDWLAMPIEDSEIRRHRAIQLNKKEMRRYRWLGWLTPGTGPVLMNEKIFELPLTSHKIFEGTGWTYEDYVDYLRKKLQKRQDHNDAISKTIRNQVMIAIGLWAILLSFIQFFVPLPYSILTAIGGGFATSYIINYICNRHSGKKIHGPL